MPKKRQRISVIWIIPILAAVVAIGIAVQRIMSEGPTITIVFKVAEGCASTPASRFYTLSAVNAPAAASSNLSVAVGPVLVPAVVDRPQIVYTTGPNQVGLDEFKRWASPPPERQEAVRHYIKHLDITVKDCITDTEDQATALQQDRQGLGLSRG